MTNFPTTTHPQATPHTKPSRYVSSYVRLVAALCFVLAMMLAGCQMADAPSSNNAEQVSADHSTPAARLLIRLDPSDLQARDTLAGSAAAAGFERRWAGAGLLASDANATHPVQFRLSIRDTAVASNAPRRTVHQSAIQLPSDAITALGNTAGTSAAPRVIVLKRPAVTVTLAATTASANTAQRDGVARISWVPGYLDAVDQLGQGQRITDALWLALLGVSADDVLAFVNTGSPLQTTDLIRLTQAGITADTLKQFRAEKLRFSVAEHLALRTAGVTPSIAVDYLQRGVPADAATLAQYHRNALAAQLAETKRIEAERLETERAEAAQAAARAAEMERLNAQLEENKRIAREQAVAEAQLAEQQKLEAEQMESQRVADIEAAAQAEATRLAAEEEAERLAAEIAEAQRMEAHYAAAVQAVDQAEAHRLAAELEETQRLEAERLAAEKEEAERLETARLEAQRIKEQIEADRLAAVKAAEQAEAARLAAEEKEAQRLEAEALAKSQADADAAMQDESIAAQTVTENTNADTNADNEPAQAVAAASDTNTDTGSTATATATATTTAAADTDATAIEETPSPSFYEAILSQIEAGPTPEASTESPASTETIKEAAPEADAVAEASAETDAAPASSDKPENTHTNQPRKPAITARDAQPAAADYAALLAKLGITEPGHAAALYEAKVPPRYILDLKNAGHQPTVIELLDAHRLGIQPAAAQILADAGYAFTLPELAKLKSAGVDPRYAAALFDERFIPMTAGQLITVWNDRVPVSAIRAKRQLALDEPSK